MFTTSLEKKEIEVDNYRFKRNKNNFCSKQCQGKYNVGRKSNRGTARDIKVNCSYCGKPKYVKSYNYVEGENYYCDIYCLGKYKTAIATVELVCDYCGKKFKRKQKNISKNTDLNFCDRKCSAAYRKKRVIFECAWCGQPVEVNECHIDRAKTRFCSDKCHGRWMSKNLVGKNNHNYNRVTVFCYTCGKKIKRKKFQVDRSDKQFCSKQCHTDYQNSPEGIEQNRLRVLKTLSQYPCRTQPEIETAKVLKSMGVWFSEQKTINDRFCVDFLLENNLIIEVMGDYFHANPKMYGDKPGLKPLNDMQKRNIPNDYRKRRYLGKCGYKILDLWESDINTGKAYDIVLDFIVSKQKGVIG